MAWRRRATARSPRRAVTCARASKGAPDRKAPRARPACRATASLGSFTLPRSPRRRHLHARLSIEPGEHLVWKRVVEIVGDHDSAFVAAENALRRRCGN